jgi:hypothetical protein
MDGNACKEPAGVASISTTSGEKEACAEALFFKVFAGDCTGNGGLPSAG